MPSWGPPVCCEDRGYKICQFLVLLDFGGIKDLLRLANAVGAAELWIVKEVYRYARLEAVASDVSESGAGEADIAA